jgi:hypothetical protein
LIVAVEEARHASNTHPTSLDSASRDPLLVLFAAYPLHLVACARLIGGIALPGAHDSWRPD